MAHVSDYVRSAVFIGNPGSGKSTLVNCQLQMHLFTSGCSASGVGVTQRLETHIHNGVRYMDTPGLSDIQLRKAAAAAIDGALQQGGIFQVCFVITLQRNRLMSDDMTTLKLVLDAAGQILPNKYSIIVNQVPTEALKKLDKSAFIANLKDALKGKEVPTTDRIHFIQEFQALADKDNKLVQLDQATMHFLANMPMLSINPEFVSPVKAEAFEEMVKQLADVEKKMAALQAKVEEAECRAASSESIAASFEKREEDRKNSLGTGIVKGVGTISGGLVGGVAGLVGGTWTAVRGQGFSQGMGECTSTGARVGGGIFGLATGTVGALLNLNTGKIGEGVRSGWGQVDRVF